MANGHADVIDKGCEYGRMSRQMMADKQEVTDMRIGAAENDIKSIFGKLDSMNSFSRNTMISAILMLVATVLGIVLK